MLRFYVEVARSSFRRLLIYRWANLAGMAANVFFGIIFCYVYIALFRARLFANPSRPPGSIAAITSPIGAR